MARPHRLPVWAGLIAIWFAGNSQLAAQTTFKCKDAGGRITYTNITCEKQGLQDAGAVAERTTTMPLGPPPQVPGKAGKPSPAPAAQSGERKDEALVDRQSTQVKPVVPLLERLVR